MCFLAPGLRICGPCSRPSGELRLCKYNSAMALRAPASASRVGHRVLAGRGSLTTNLLPVDFDFDSFRVWKRSVEEGEDLRSLRESIRTDWYVYWDCGEVYLLPLSDAAAALPNTCVVELEVNRSLRLLARLVEDALVRRFPRYEPTREHPFTFLGHQGEIMGGLSQSLGLKHPLLAEFEIWPKYTFDARIIEVQHGSPFIAIAVDLATRWRITADLDDLADAGVDITGLYVVRRDPEPAERRLVGRVASIGSGRIELSESMEGITSINTSDVMLEGRKDAFTRCLKHLLGARDYARYDNCRDKRVGDLLGGPPLLDKVRHVAATLAERPLDLAVGLSCVVREPFLMTNSSRSKTVTAVNHLDYCFDSARRKRHQYAWPGLEAYGPFSCDTFDRPSPRILVVCPHTLMSEVETFVRQLRDGIPTHKAFHAGMRKTFGLSDLRFEYAAVDCTSGDSVADHYRRAIHGALSRGDLPDAAIVVVRDQDSDLPDILNPYLHSKALLLMAGVASQEAKLSTITRQPYELQYAMQNISIALYAKMNGVPWTIGHRLTLADELVIGVGTAELSESRTADRQRYIGITTVFRSDGNYLLGQLSREASFAEYPAVLRDTTRDAIEEIKKRNGWQPGDMVRLIFHAARPPKYIDFARLMMEAVAAIGKEQDVEVAFVTVSHDHPFALFDTSQRGKETAKGRKGEFAPDRGLIVQTGRYSRLVSTTGVTLVKRPGLPLPRPLQVHLQRGSTFTDLDYLSEQVLKFTGLSWRSTQPAARPVTIYYSELIARLLGRMKAVPGWSPTLLDTRLRTSKWFI